MARKANGLRAMVALDHAFGKSLTRKRQFKLGATPAIYIAGYLGTLSLDWRVGLIAFVISLIGCYYWLLPQAVRAEYEQESLNQRNLLINQLSQSLIDVTKPYQTRLANGRDAISGSTKPEDEDFNQLKADMNLLVTRVFRRESDTAVHDAFMDFISKYEDDDIFVLFFEQVETLARQGFMDNNVISSLRNQHNELYRKNLEYIAKINLQKRQFFIMSTYSFGLIALIMTSLSPAAGKDVFKHMFTHGVMGIVVMLIFISAYIGLLKAFYTLYFDRSLTSFGKAKKKKRKKNEVKMTQRMIDRRNQAFINSKFNIFLYDTITSSEHKLMDGMNLSTIERVKFQYQRFIFMFVGGLVFTSVVYTFAGVWQGIASFFVGFVGLYFLKGHSLRGGLVEYKLKRAMAFAKFTRLVIPYLKSAQGRNGFLIFETISHRLDDEGDQGIVYSFLNELREDPSSDLPYIHFAERFDGNQRSITFMRAIYGVLNTDGGTDIVDALNQQANDEFMAKVDEVIARKLGKYDAFIGANVLVAMIAVAGIIGSFLMIALKGAHL